MKRFLLLFLLLPVFAFAAPDKYVLPSRAAFKSFELNLHLEPSYELLQPTQSFIKVSDADGRVLAQAKVRSLKTKLVWKETPRGKVFIQAKIYFCRHTAQGLCLVKDFRFEVPVKGKAQKGPLKLELRLPNDHRRT